jgi:hypothetical protein
MYTQMDAQHKVTEYMLTTNELNNSAMNWHVNSTFFFLSKNDKQILEWKDFAKSLLTA